VRTKEKTKITTVSPTFRSPDGRVELYHGDAFETLPKLGRLGAIITDPPFSDRTHDGHNASANGHHYGHAQSSKARMRRDLSYNFLTEEQCDRLAKLFNERCDGWIAWMTDHVLMPSINKGMEDCGRYVFAPLPFLAVGSRVRLSGDGPSSWTIWICVSRTNWQARWGTLPGGYLSKPGWQEPKAKSRVGGKPLRLMQCLVNDYSRENDLVCDPFMGHGTTGVACVQTGRRFIGIEKDDQAYRTAEARIQAELAQAKFSF
jgi:site-specific DNA-methyltransferase (adenine-specific)